MNGRQGNEFPQGEPGGGFGDPTGGQAGAGGSGDWFTPRTPAPGNPNYAGSDPLGQGPAAPEWSAPARGFSGASDPGGARYGSGGFGGSARSESGPYESFDPYDSGEVRGPAESGGFYGGGGGSGSGGGGDWEGGGGDVPRKRGKAAVMVPLAGAIGLACLAGISVYAFAASGGGCGGGNAITLNVAAAPDIAPAISKTADDFNSQSHSVNGKCVKAVVSDADPAAVTTLLSGQGVSEGQTQQPDVWIPDSTLWADLVLTTDKGKDAVHPTKTSVATTPLVVAMPKSLTGQLAKTGMLSNPSWDNLLAAVGGLPGGAVTKNQTIPAGLIKFSVPDPTHNAAGMSALMLTNELLASDPNKQTIFTGIVRTVQHAVTPTVDSQFVKFGPDARGRFPVALSTEQAVWKHNQGKPADPAVAIYPTEGSTELDYPYTVTTSDSTKQQAAALLEKAMSSANTQNWVRGLGFRTADGKAPDSFGDATGVSPRRPRELPQPTAQEVKGVMQAWAKLGLSIRLLTVIDVSNTMSASVPGTNMNRLQAVAKVAQGGLALLDDSTELGIEVFSSHMDGNKPYRTLIPVGPLGQRQGSLTRRDLIQAGLAKVQVNKGANTALYETLIAAYSDMKKSYEPDKINSILLLTNGTDHLPGGLSIDDTVNQLKSMYDPKHPVQVIIIGFGKNADRAELEKLTSATEGGAYVAQTPEEVQRIFLEAISKRMCNPDCGNN